MKLYRRGCKTQDNMSIVFLTISTCTTAQTPVQYLNKIRSIPSEKIKQFTCVCLFIQETVLNQKCTCLSFMGSPDPYCVQLSKLHKMILWRGFVVMMSYQLASVWTLSKPLSRILEHTSVLYQDRIVFPIILLWSM